MSRTGWPGRSEVKEQRSNEAKKQRREKLFTAENAEICGDGKEDRVADLKFGHYIWSGYGCANKSGDTGGF